MADPSTTGALPVRLISWNVKGLNGQLKRARVFSHLRGLQADITFLQETHLRVSDQCRLRKSWVGHVFHSNFTTRARGTAILINKRVPFVPADIISDVQGRYIIVSGSLPDSSGSS